MPDVRIIAREIKELDPPVVRSVRRIIAAEMLDEAPAFKVDALALLACRVVKDEKLSSRGR